MIVQIILAALLLPLLWFLLTDRDDPAEQTAPAEEQLPVPEHPRPADFSRQEPLLQRLTPRV